MSVTLDRVNSPVRQRRDFASLPEVLPLPDLIQTQLDSFKWFCDEGLGELFKEISPIQDFTGKSSPRPSAQNHLKLSSWVWIRFGSGSTSGSEAKLRRTRADEKTRSRVMDMDGPSSGA